MTGQNVVQKYLQPGEIKLDWIPKEWPLTPLAANKNPYIRNWQTDPKSVEDIADEINEGRCKAIGLLAGPCFNSPYGLLWVDIDGPSVVEKIEELSHLPFEQALTPTLTVCSGREGRQRRLYRIAKTDFSHFIRNKYSWSTATPGEKLELLWSKHQGVLMGLHPETSGFYNPQGLGFEWCTDLPLAPSWILNAILSKNARNGPPIKQVTRVEGPGFGFSLVQDTDHDVETALEALWSLPTELSDDYHNWITIGQALHSVSEGLLEQWDLWSQQSDKYEDGVCAQKWSTFRSDGEGIGLGTLIEISKQYSNVIRQHFANKAAALPSDFDLDLIEAIRQQQYALDAESVYDTQQRIADVNQVLDGIAEDMYGLTGMEIESVPVDTSASSDGAKQNQSKRNPPANVIRDLVLEKIGDCTRYDPTREAFYQYEYESPGLWTRLDKVQIEGVIQRVLDHLELPRGYAQSTIQGVLDLLGPRLRHDAWYQDGDYLNFKNGVLNVNTMTLMPHKKDLYMVNQLPFDFDPDKDCPKVKRWLAFTQYNNEDMVKVLQAWLRAVLLSHHQLQMFLEVVGAAGAGKAQPLTARVLTPNGWSTMENLKVGQEVLAADGTPSAILGIYPQGSKEIYRLRFDDGSQTECCKEHLWSVYLDQDRVPCVKSLGELMEWKQQHPQGKIAIPLMKAAQFDPITIPTPVETIADVIASTECMIPLVYLHNSITVRTDLLQRIMDANGWIDSKGRCVLRVKNEYLSTDLKFLIESLGGQVCLTPQRSESSHHGVEWDLIFYMPREIAPFYRNEQQLKQWRQHEVYAESKVLEAIEAVGNKEAQCIYIDHPSHLYVTDDFVVTHNTSFANLCIALVGYQNTFSSRLQLLESNRFEVSGAYNKRLVVINDADRYGGGVEVLKAMTGGDQLRIEFKYQKQSGSGFNYKGLVMATANESIQTTDMTGGLFRRRLTVPFTRSRNSARGDQRDRVMMSFKDDGTPYGYLADELPGVVNWVLSMSHEEMIQYTKHAVDNVDHLKQHRAEQVSENNNIIDWLNDRIVYDPNIASIVGERRDGEGEYYYQHAERWLYASYCDHCRKGNVREVGRRRFISLLNDICNHQLKIKVRLFNGSRGRYMFKGLAIRRPNDNSYEGYPSIVAYSLDQGGYETLYGNQDFVEAQIDDKEYMAMRQQPVVERGELPELPF